MAIDETEAKTMREDTVVEMVNMAVEEEVRSSNKFLFVIFTECFCSNAHIPIQIHSDLSTCIMSCSSDG